MGRLLRIAYGHTDDDVRVVDVRESRYLRTRPAACFSPGEHNITSRFIGSMAIRVAATATPLLAMAYASIAGFGVRGIIAVGYVTWTGAVGACFVYRRVGIR